MDSQVWYSQSVLKLFASKLYLRFSPKEQMFPGSQTVSKKSLLNVELLSTDLTSLLFFLDF